MVNAGLSPKDCAQQSTFERPAVGIFERLDPQPGELILDVGCGDGTLAARMVEAGAKVIGLDSSESMVEAARARGVDAFVADAESLDLPAQAQRFGQFDAVFSTAALQWTFDPDAAVTGIFEALKEGGRFVGEMSGEGDLLILRQALHEELAERGHSVPSEHRWSPDAEQFARLHCVAGFTEVEAELIELPAALADGVSGWVTAACSTAMDLAMVPQWEREPIAQAVEKRVEGRLRHSDGQYFADHVRLRFSMKKPG